MSNSDNSEIVNTEEFNAAEAESATAAEENALGCFTYKLGKPLSYNGTDISIIKFDFDSLTGRDAAAIEEELAMRGKAVIAPAFSVDYILAMCSKASTPKVGADIFELMSIKDFNQIRAKGRSFLLQTER